ncbi:ATP-dependent DNA helicase [Trichonephila clavata]|uniref:ATP-dependent DNA helicase n=1 Tax=Trichonephila clavata TaxID=2740835 RepID=A0A8X6JGZ4_TRICU|nr:ATP-dependent DNA helicase [Trichonephila clavata]
MVVLPSSFTGGSRYMHERTQDAMTYVRHFGRPDLYITFTCNPKWPEIIDLLNKGQKSHDRHDIIARVFRVKVKHMMKLLTKGCILGNVRCHMYTVEWQKRGLPHVHILLSLEDKIRPESIDEVICAELPDSNIDPALYEIIRTTMIHGPCGHINKSSP